MNSRTDNRTPTRPACTQAVAWLSAFALLALAILSASPVAHAWIHVDAAQGHGHDHGDHKHHQDPGHDTPDAHTCGVTLAQQGFCDTTPIFAGVTAPTKIVEPWTTTPHSVRWLAPQHWLQPSQGPPLTGRD